MHATLTPTDNRAAPGKPARSGETTTLRAARADDVAACARICFEAFRDIAGRHGFPQDFPDPGPAEALLHAALAQSDAHVVVAETGDRVVGSNVAWDQAPVVGIGPITVDPAVQNGAVGRRLMQHVLAQADAGGFTSVRLVQAAYHNRSLALYTSLGFDAKEPLSTMQGPPVGVTLPERPVRPAGDADVEACGRLCEQVHGFRRDSDLRAGIAQGTAMVVTQGGAITGYCAQVGFFGHAVGRADDDLIALIGAAPSFPGPGFLVPTRNGRLLRWCLAHGLRIVQPMTLMARGAYRETAGSWLPSVIY